MVNGTTAARVALLLVDYQVALCEEGELCRLPALAAQVRERGVVARAAETLAAARARGVFVVHVRLGFDPSYELRTNRTPRWDAYPANRAMLADSPEARIVAALAPLDHEPVVVKGAVDPFVGTPLTSMLLGHGIRSVAVAGVATNLAVESGVRHAADSGFAVTVLEDLCASFSAEAHAFSTETILPMFAGVSPAEEWLGALGAEA
jgi:nicotinamidase-related amidase